MCANADNDATKKEMDMIKAKVDTETFEKMEEIFRSDSENKRFKKIDKNIQQQIYSAKELSVFKSEMNEIFFSDRNFSMMEKRLEQTLDNILY
tara:strand:+ start:40256 stop:40534 length:279 start_codon:yes stop_codon:yes gene_type:complete